MVDQKRYYWELGCIKHRWNHRVPDCYMRVAYKVRNSDLFSLARLHSENKRSSWYMMVQMYQCTYTLTDFCKEERSVLTRHQWKLHLLI